MPPALAAIARIFAREAALKVAQQGLRGWPEREAPTTRRSPRWNLL